jgi:hypothetical protein
MVRWQDLNLRLLLSHVPIDTEPAILRIGGEVYKTVRMTPALVAGITDKLWTMEDVVVALIDADAPKPGPRGPYRKKKPVA